MEGPFHVFHVFHVFLSFPMDMSHMTDCFSVKKGMTDWSPIKAIAEIIFEEGLTQAYPCSLLDRRQIFTKV